MLLVAVNPVAEFRMWQEKDVEWNALTQFLILLAVTMILQYELLTSELSWLTLVEPSAWIHSVTSEEVESERMAVLNLLSETSGSEDGKKQDEIGTPTADSAGTLLPAPPGITEIVLTDSQADAFKEMRAHLTSVRLYHKIVLWSLIIAFMTFFGVGVFKLISKMQSATDYLQAFGSAGVGGLLLWFGQRTLWANRVSQLSLALFESYVAEVSASLEEIPRSASPQQRRNMRSEIWAGFRTGLNRIWLLRKNS